MVSCGDEYLPLVAASGYNNIEQTLYNPGLPEIMTMAGKAEARILQQVTLHMFLRMQYGARVSQHTVL